MSNSFHCRLSIDGAVVSEAASRFSHLSLSNPIDVAANRSVVTHESTIFNFRLTNTGIIPVIVDHATFNQGLIFVEFGLQDDYQGHAVAGTVHDATAVGGNVVLKNTVLKHWLAGPAIAVVI